MASTQPLSDEEKREKTRKYQREWAREKRKEGTHSTCSAEYKAKKQIYDRAYTRSVRLQKKYGITEEQRDAMFAAQGNVCAICSTDTPKGRGDWHVDHCHATGVVRGLLCSPCNSALGLFKDSPDILSKAISYLGR